MHPTAARYTHKKKGEIYRALCDYGDFFHGIMPLDMASSFYMFVVPVGPSTSISFLYRLTDAPEGSLLRKKYKRADKVTELPTTQ
jgi:hypothetical protein